MHHDEITRHKVDVIVRELDRLYPDMPAVPLEYTTPWELLVAVILSAQCTDVMVNKVTRTLFAKYPRLEDYVNANRYEFELDIKPTGFYQNKAKNILATAQIIYTDYGGRIPDSMEELVALPGVGRKTANVVLSVLHNKVEGIVVDTHIKRLAIKFGLTTNTSPEKIEKDLMRLVDKKDWWSFANKLKKYGQDYSPAYKKHDTSDPISQVLG